MYYNVFEVKFWEEVHIMVNTGHIRKIDNLGRVTLSIEARKELGWDIKDRLTSVVDKANGTITLKLHEKNSDPKCVFCNAKESAARLHNRDICKSCLASIK